MSWFKRILELFGSYLPAVLLSIVLIVVSADVIIRTALHESFHTAHDISILAFAGVVWFGIIGASLNKQLFGVRFFVDKLPSRPRRWLQALTHLVIIVISLAVIRAAIAQVQTARFTTFLALGWPKWIVSAALGVAMATIIVVQILQLFELWHSRSVR
jgi:TRAP-type C4-dicarboxylate transport system permease small subunit